MLDSVLLKGIVWYIDSEGIPGTSKKKILAVI